MKTHRPKYKYRAPMLRAFWYWINERHSIWQKRKDGQIFPWTKDKILRTFKFTNVFRQLDWVTEEWTKRYIRILSRDSLKSVRDGDLLFHLCMFRMFNWPATYDTLFYGMRRWNKKKAIALLTDRKNRKLQVFTGAYIITNAGSTKSKIEVICDALDEVYLKRRKLASFIRRKQSMKKCVEKLQEIPTIGPFIAYEIACDLRHTKLLADAKDIMSWANPGPGAKRGIHRIIWGQKDVPKKQERPNYIRAMYDLFYMATYQRGTIGKHVKECEWPFEMREIEHSLCEFDKHQRVKNDEGRPRSRYTSRNVCKICEGKLNDPIDPLTTDMSGNCLKCTADAGDPAAKKMVREIRRKKHGRHA